ncbi:hypothetical protein SteCoe_11050 [Stentor coeruleus]|uniref:Rab-GAP TBC domain-containing protein n=1 Tax=Stentor coeruleus TaxID=5963 RepID=A0A1R2CE49_9CILI|nr:hypothetical protein SteCoe_11050 [Stentor coeruleus]
MDIRRRVKHSLTQVPTSPSSNILENDHETYYPSDEPMSLSKRMLNVLTNPHSFIKYSRSGKRKCCSVYFNETLQKMSVDKPCSTYILTTDIQAAELGFSPSLSFASPDPNNIFGFRIFTTMKVYEFSTENRILRDEFVKSLNTLGKLNKEYMGPMGLKKYCESIIHSQEGEDSIKALHKSRYQNQERLTNNKELEEILEVQVIKGVVYNMINILETREKEIECNKLRKSIKESSNERSILTNKQDTLRMLIIKKDQEILSLKQDINKVENQIEQLRKPTYTHDSNVYSLKIWTSILEFLTAKDIVMLRMTTRNFRIATNRVLLIKSVWRRLCLSSLNPRKIMYRLYTNNFYNAAIRGVMFEVDEEIAEEIHNDVWRGLNDNNKETEKILLLLCKYNASLSYCQGMHFVAHFLYGIYGNIDEVLRVMDALLRPPFYLSELWKNGFSRLRLGIFQLDFLMKIRLPYFAKHLKDLDINLDMVVTPWFLTVFTYFQYELELPRKTVLEIWDYFLIQGWPALISVCLTIFHLTEHLVLEKSLEQTLMILKNKIPYNDVCKVLPEFEVDPSLLEDLEISHVWSGA